MLMLSAMLLQLIETGLSCLAITLAMDPALGEQRP